MNFKVEPIILRKQLQGTCPFTIFVQVKFLNFCSVNRRMLRQNVKTIPEGKFLDFYTSNTQATWITWKPFHSKSMVKMASAIFYSMYNILNQEKSYKPLSVRF